MLFMEHCVYFCVLCRLKPGRQTCMVIGRTVCILTLNPVHHLIISAT